VANRGEGINRDVDKQKYIYGKQRRREDHLFLSRAQRRRKNLYISALSGLGVGNVLAISTDPAKGIIEIMVKDIDYDEYDLECHRRIGKQGKRGMAVRCTRICKEMPIGRYVRIMKWKSIKHYQHETMLPDVQEGERQK
jgi:hypothetical protein